jgi:hypothetical protein
VTVELQECDEFRILDSDREISTLDKPLTLRRADWTNGSVLIKAYGKRRIVTRYASWHLYLADGTPLPDEELDQIVATYYGL